MARIQIAISDEQQACEWLKLYRRMLKVMRPLGRDDYGSDGDYWVFNENWGPECLQQKIFIFNLEMIRPEVIQALRRQLASYPHWEIVIAICSNESWPEMGLYVRHHEIIDGLQRDYFPPEYRGFQYEDARPGTEND